MVTLPFVTEETWWSYDGDRIPNSLDASWRSALESFADMNSGERDALRRTVTSLQYRTLLIFGKRMATLAVRERSPALIREGLVGVALAGGSPHDDPRDIGDALFPLRDAASLLGKQAAGFFYPVAVLAEPRTADAIRWAEPSVGLIGAVLRIVRRAIADRGWAPSRDADGFRYGQPGTMSLNDAHQLVETMRKAASEHR